MNISLVHHLYRKSTAVTITFPSPALLPKLTSSNIDVFEVPTRTLAKHTGVIARGKFSEEKYRVSIHPSVTECINLEEIACTMESNLALVGGEESYVYGWWQTRADESTIDTVRRLILNKGITVALQWVQEHLDRKAIIVRCSGGWYGDVEGISFGSGNMESNQSSAQLFIQIVEGDFSDIALEKKSSSTHEWERVASIDVPNSDIPGSLEQILEGFEVEISEAGDFTLEPSIKI